MQQSVNSKSMLCVGTILRGMYRIDGYLSSGGFGNTYIATNTEFEETVAIKEFFMKGVTERDETTSVVSVSNADNVQIFEEQREKFKKEARRIRQLNNPHIVRVHDLFEENGTAYYVMDYIDGENLAERLKRTGKPMSEKKVREILPQILDALKSVHEAGFCHLDLKPSNIMLEKSDLIKLIDFGASKQLGASGTLTTNDPTALAQTPGFAPREQMEQNFTKIGAWTDIYALGATLYNLLTKKLPPLPTNIDDDETEDKHVALPFPITVSDEMKSLVLSMMKTNRLERPSSVKEIQEFIDKKEDADVTVVEVPLEKKLSETTIEPKTPISEEKAETGNPVHEKGNSTKMIIAAFSVVILAVGGYSLLNTSGSQKEENQMPQAQNDLIIQNLINNMVYVQGGTFMMGATAEQVSDAHVNEKPAHQVTLSSFSIGRYEVTQEEWQAVMGSNPSENKSPKRPVENVSWNKCQEFFRKLNAITGKQFRLPSEAEWEYAARGGNRSCGYKYAGGNDLNSVAWYYDNSGNQTHEVGGKQSNELGLYDMSGNVFEWCQDRYGVYSSSSQTNPTGSSSGPGRVYRGGHWRSHEWFCRVSDRHRESPGYRDACLGFRLAQ